MGSDARQDKANDQQQSWEVRFTPEAERWYKRLGAEDKHRIGKAVIRLQRTGPYLGEPAVKRIESSRHHNMKELRSFGGNLRALFAFDPNRRAIVLVGGDKTNHWKGWYRRNVPRADKLYDTHLRTLGKEAPCPGRTPRAGARSASRAR